MKHGYGVYQWADGSEFKVQIQERELSDMDLKHMGRVFVSWESDRAHFIGAGSILRAKR